MASSENLFQVKNGSKAYASKVLFDQISFSINSGEHVGVIGPNGAGKTTLFKVLVNQEEFDSGEVTRSRSMRLAYLSQHDDWDLEQTAEQYLTSDEGLGIWELKQKGRDLGLFEEHYERPIGSFSGGYRMRFKLLKLLANEPNLLLLDEPTNYLDLETVVILERFLQGYAGAFLLISHDREFLRRTTNHILEIEGGEVTKFPGNLDDYFEQKALLREQLESRAASLAEKRKTILDFVARFGAKATKASQAQSRLKQLDKMETIEIKPLASAARIPIPAPAPTGKLSVKLDGLTLGYGDRTVLTDVSAHIMRGDHLAVVGFNGAGKSTLLKALAGRLEPKSGKIEWGHEVKAAYFAQHVAEELNSNHTVLEALQSKAHLSVRPQEILGLAGALMFSGDDVKKPVRVLSGGERTRVALGQVLLAKASLLILDEPTNHLDFQTVEALTESLTRYEGSVIVVSHDRGFVRRVGTKLLEVRDGHTLVYPGTYDEYAWSVARGMYAVLQSGKAPATGGGSVAASFRDGAPPVEVAAPTPKVNYRDAKKDLEKRLRPLKTKIERAERRLEELKERVLDLNDKVVSASDSQRGAYIFELSTAQTEINALEEAWIVDSESVHEIEAELARLTQAGA